MLKKEFTSIIRTNKLIIIMILAVAFGIMSPAIAKLTPTLIEAFAESDVSISIKIGEVDAVMSWQQFYKNTPMLLIVFVLVFGGILVNEFSKNTLVLIVTKGIERWKIIMAKSVCLTAVWTVTYWVCYYITYIYTDIYWDNSIMNNLLNSGVCYWLFGVVIVSLIMLFSTIGGTYVAAIAGPAVVYFVCSLLGLVQKIAKYLPTQLANPACMSGAELSDYYAAIIIGIVIIVAANVGAVAAFNKKEM